MSIVSAIRDIPISETLIAFGEVGLSGELRNVPRVQERIKEAARLGFTECVLPKNCIKGLTDIPDGIKLIGVRNLKEALSLIK